MKKLFVISIILVSLITFGSIGNKPATADSIKEKLVRFHVIANSDSDEDQRVKLLVRDAILKKIGGRLENVNTQEESLVILDESIPEIEKIANSVLTREGKTYKSKAMVGDFEFPVKNYNTITLPAGTYKALRVVLGNGDGKNWWCVMFPPLCFIDITRGITAEKTDTELKKVLTEDEVESITAFKQQTEKKEIVLTKKNTETSEQKLSASDRTVQKNDVQAQQGQSQSQSSTEQIEFRFRSIDLFKSAFEKVRDMFE